MPPRIWSLVLDFNLTALGQKCRPICVDSNIRYFLAGTTVCEWIPCPTQVIIREGDYGEGIPGGGRAGWLASKGHPPRKPLAHLP